MRIMPRERSHVRRGVFNENLAGPTRLASNPGST